MTTASIYGGVAQSAGLYGLPTSNASKSIFEWFIFQVSATQPATPTGGTWDFATATGTPPSGWSQTPPAYPTNLVWLSISIVNSAATTALTWSAPGQVAYSYGSGGSGYSGFSGYSGASGYSGGAGASGFSGYSGLGISGFSGFSGYSGAGGSSLGISNDTSTATNLYPTFAGATSGTVSTLYTSNAKYLYKPSTGDLQASQLIATNGLVLNNATVSSSYTIPAGLNAQSVGPVTIASGQSVTVSSGQRWVVL
jgi:hypothetical protein